MEKDRSAISTPGVGLRPSPRRQWHVHGSPELLEGRSVSFLVLPSSLSFSLLLTPLSPLSFQVLFNVRPSSRWENLNAAQNPACSAQQENTFGSIQRLCGGCTKLRGQDVTCEPQEMCPTFCHRLWPLLHKPDKPQ